MRVMPRYDEARPGPGRCLKLSMTDGEQRVEAVEYEPCHQLAYPAMPAGFKVTPYVGP